MKLSYLVYLVVKNTKYLDDTGFTYEAFIHGDFKDDPDYVNTINNAMTPINEAIHRLSDRNKIAYKTFNAGCPTPDGMLHIVSVEDLHIKKIKGVFFTYNGEYITVPYREIDKTTIYVGSDPRVNHIIQYIEDIPSFKISIIYQSNSDVELLTYGISETMCSYIIEYSQGRLQEVIAPELANMHISRAEQYFADLEEQQTYFSKNLVKRKFSIK